MEKKKKKVSKSKVKNKVSRSKVKRRRRMPIEIEEEIPTPTEYDSSRTTNTAFILMFPTLILAGIAAINSTLPSGLLAIALAIYQFLMLKKFIEDFYRNR